MVSQLSTAREIFLNKEPHPDCPRHQSKCLCGHLPLLPPLRMTSGPPCTAHMGTGSSLNCRTGSWAHPCSASGCHAAGTRPSPCDMQPTPRQKLPSDFLYLHHSRRAFTTLGCGRLHTCWHASNSPLTSLPSLHRDQQTTPLPRKGQHCCSSDYHHQTSRPGAQGSLFIPSIRMGDPVLQTTAPKAGRALVGHSGWWATLWGPQNGPQPHQNAVLPAWAMPLPWGQRDKRGKPGCPAPQASPGPGVPVFYYLLCHVKKGF